MAKKDIPVEDWASFFASCVSAEDDGRPAASEESAFIQDDVAALFEGEETATQSVERDGKHQKRHQKRQHRPASPKLFAKTLANNRLSFNSVEKGYPRKGFSQTARRQETEMIRFLHLEADFV